LSQVLIYIIVGIILTNPLDNQDRNLVQWIKELTLLAGKSPLRGPELATAKNLMRMIKQCGYTNKEIQELTSSSWSESTIKLYTRNIAGIQPVMKAQHLALLNELINGGFTIDDVRKGSSLLSELRKMDLTLKDLSGIFEYLGEKKTLLPSLIDTVSKLRRYEIAPEKLVELSELKKTMDERGFDLEFIQRINDLEKMYSDKESMLQTVLLFGDLSQIRSEVRRGHKERDEIIKDTFSLKKELSELIKEKELNRIEISQARELDSIGLSASILRYLSDISKKYGQDLEAIVKAIYKYSDAALLESHIASLTAEESALKLSIEGLKSKSAHLDNLSKISAAFLEKFKFNVDDADLIYKVATMYGDPSSFFRALARFSNIKDLEFKVSELENKKLELESINSELNRVKMELELHVRHLEGTAQSTLMEVSSGTTKVFSKVAEEIIFRLNQTLVDLKKAYDQYSILRARINSSKERLRVCSVIKSVMYNDLEAIQGIPSGYVEMFIQAALNICIGKHLKAAATVVPNMAAKYDIIPLTNIELTDLLELARNASRGLHS
jgi:hypothetical protein